MELEGDSPAPRPAAAPEPVPTQNIHVTPENVVALAAMFRDCADILEPVAADADQDLHLNEPWMEDDVSVWAMNHFNNYFVNGENSVANVLKAEYKQYLDMRDALVATALRYGLTDELAAAKFTEAGTAT